MPCKWGYFFFCACQGKPDDAAVTNNPQILVAYNHRGYCLNFFLFLSFVLFFFFLSLLFLSFFLVSFFLSWLERKIETLICCSTYLCIHWLILVCALSGDRTRNLGIWEDTLTTWDTQQGPEASFLLTLHVHHRLIRISTGVILT